MFNKIIKIGQRKVSKSDGNLDSNGNSGSVSGANVVVNHASRGGQSNPSSDQPGGGGGGGGGGVSTAAAPPPGPIQALPLFKDVPMAERQNLFLRKVQASCFQYELSDSLKMVREKEIKRQSLVELIDCVQSGSLKIIETNQEEMVRMIAINIFRPLPPAAHENTGCMILEPEEDEPYFDPSWPHLQLVYELLLRYVVSTDTDTKVAKRYIDHSFVLKLLELFNSEDSREREYLKTILHRIYGKFMVHRPFIRKGINNIFYRFIYETERHSGIGELLEILGSIINGFALPMKEEHKLFLVRALIPLHKPKSVGLYHQQLSYCITQFVEKDYKLADIVIRGLLKYWPVTNCQKEILFLGELEEILEATQAAEFQRCMVPLFKQIRRCLNSSHFQVSERTLLLWNNEHIVALISQNRKEILPIIFEALEKNIKSHWNQAINGLSMNVRKMFLELDTELFEECQKQYEEKEAKAGDIEEMRETTWKKLVAAADNGG